MHIQIQTEGKSLHLPLPSGLVLNRLTVRLVMKALTQKGICLSVTQAMKLVDCIVEYRKTHPEWVLVEVCSHEGEHIVVKL